MQRSNSIVPPWIVSIRSSAPTMSAPAASASSAFAPRANTATRTVLPVPFGRVTVPRTIWSAWRGSIPRIIAISTDSSNFAVAFDFTSATASSTVRLSLPSKALRAERVRLPSLPMIYPFTSMPIDFAEPRMIFIAWSTSFADRSCIFASAISRSCALVTVPTVSREGVLAPDFSLAAFLR